MPGGEGSDRSGLALMVGSAASFALMAAFAKWLLPDTPTQAIVFSRGVLVSSVLALYAARRGVPLTGRDTRRLILRGLFGYAGLSCYFWSVHHLPLGDAVLLQYSHPVVVAVLAPFLLGERTARGHWPLILAALAGVGLVVGATGTVRVEALAGLTGAVFSALAYIAVRRLARTEHPVTIMVWFPLVTVLPSGVATLRAGTAALPSSGVEVLGHLAVSGAAILGQVTLTVGLSRIDAARATAMSMTGPVFGALYGLLLFGTWPSIPSAAGAVLVIGSVVVLARIRRPG